MSKHYVVHYSKAAKLGFSTLRGSANANTESSGRAGIVVRHIIGKPLHFTMNVHGDDRQALMAEIRRITRASPSLVMASNQEE